MSFEIGMLILLTVALVCGTVIYGIYASAMKLNSILTIIDRVAKNIEINVKIKENRNEN